MPLRYIAWIYCITCVLAVSPSIVVAQAPNALTSVLAAHGGAALSALHTLRLTGQSTRNGKTQPVTIWAAADGRVRFDYGQPVTHSVVRGVPLPFDIVNGRLAPKPPHTDAFAQLDLLAPLAVVNYSATNAQLMSLGAMRVGTTGTQGYRVSTSRQQTHYQRIIADTMQMDVEPRTGLLLGVTRQQYAEESLDHPFILSYAFGDHRTVSGVTLPFRIDKSINGIVRETIVISSVQLNPVLSRDLFSR